MTVYPLVNQTNIGEVERTEEESAFVRKGSESMLDLYNGVPDDLKMTVVVSFIASLCMNCPEPKAVLFEIFEAVGEGVWNFTAQHGKH